MTLNVVYIFCFVYYMVSVSMHPCCLQVHSCFEAIEANCSSSPLSPHYYISISLQITTGIYFPCTHQTSILAHTRLVCYAHTRLVYYAHTRLVYYAHTRLVCYAHTRLVYYAHTRLVCYAHTRLVYYAHTRLEIL